MKTRNLHYSGLLTFLFLSLLSGRGWATVIHIPGDVDTFTHAKQTCTASPTPGIVQYDSNRTESINWDSNAIGTVQGKSRGITITCSAGSFAIDYAGGTTLTIPTSILNITLVGDTTTSSLRYTSFGTGFTSYVSGSNIIQTGSGGNAAGVRLNAIPIATSQLIFFNDYIHSLSNTGTSGAFTFGSLGTTAHSVKVSNSFITDPNGYGYLDATAVSSTDIIDWNNVTFANSVTGYSGKSGEAVTNCAFFRNTVDLSLTSPATGSDFDHSVFTQLGSLSGSTNCIFSTNARELCNFALAFLSPASLSRTAGISITGVTDQAGLNGVGLQNGCPSGSAAMGCMGCSSALCGRPNYSGVAQ